MVKSFGFTIVSTDAEERVVVLIPGSFPVDGYSGADFAGLTLHKHNPAELIAAGKNIDFVLDDGQIDDANSKMTVTSLSKRKSVRHFLNYIGKFAHRCQKIVVQANNPDVFGGVFEYGATSALESSGETEIPMQRYRQLDSNVDDKINIPVDIYLSARSYLAVTIPGGGRTVTITFEDLTPVK